MSECVETQAQVEPFGLLMFWWEAYTCFVRWVFCIVFLLLF